MVENGYVVEGGRRGCEGAAARRAHAPRYVPRSPSDYFTEEVRREIIDRYGEKALYEGGLSVRTTLDPKLQVEARKALQDGLINYDEGRGYRGPVKNIDISGDWGVPLSKVDGLSDVPEWHLAVVLSVSSRWRCDRASAAGR